jgi:hypothetical protein
MRRGAPRRLPISVAWLHRGPPMARVDAVEVEEIEPASRDWPSAFSIVSGASM